MSWDATTTDRNEWVNLSVLIVSIRSFLLYPDEPLCEELSILMH